MSNLSKQYTEAPHGYVGDNKWMKHTGYRFMVGSGRNVFFMNLISGIKQRQEACVLCVTGRGGRGKSYIATRLAQILDPKFKPELQVVYDTKQLMMLLSEDSPLKRWQVIIVDEAQMSMGNRTWSDELQKGLMSQMEAVRSKGYVIIIVSLGIDLLDVVMRKHVINYRIDVQKRGVGYVYSYFADTFTGEERHKALGEVRFLLPGWKFCQVVPPLSCLTCKFSGLTKSMYSNRDKWDSEGFEPCDNLRNVYEHKKKFYVEMANKKSLEKAEAKAEKSMGETDEMLVEELKILRPTIRINKKEGSLNVGDMLAKLNANKKGRRVGKDRGNKLRAMLDLPDNKISEKST